ncbi:MAG: HprK-related kinase A [Rhodobacterales bacterium]|nr:HprK-related kinase A [Rhodobacterales bacterium]
MRLADLARDELNRRLAGPGLAVRTGPFVFRARTDVDLVQDGLALLYADYPVLDAAPFADYHVSVLPSRGPRRWYRPQVHFALDEFHPFRPFPRDHALPLFEWGLNWSIATTVNQYLMIHSAVIERGGRAVILPAPPGSGKSTLCAALIHRGWRLLSDELALVRLDGSAILPLARPISLKNRSIEIIRDYLPEAVLSPRCEGTAKGTVALLKAPSESVARKQEPARPAWIVFPKWQAGAEAAMTPRSKADTFLKIGENAFNYSTLGRTGFESLARVVDACACSDFIYSRLDDAVAHFEALAAEGEGTP